jgi:hypothetical protein
VATFCGFDTSDHPLRESGLQFIDDLGMVSTDLRDYEGSFVFCHHLAGEPEESPRVHQPAERKSIDLEVQRDLPHGGFIARVRYWDDACDVIHGPEHPHKVGSILQTVGQDQEAEAPVTRKLGRYLPEKIDALVAIEVHRRAPNSLTGHDS